MGEKEFDKKFPEIVVNVKGIHDKEKLHQFVLEKMNTQLDLYDNVAYRYYFFEDYSENESKMFLI